MSMTRGLATAVLTLSLLTVPLITSAETGTCAKELDLMGLCNTGTEIVIEDTWQSPGSPSQPVEWDDSSVDPGAPGTGIPTCGPDSADQRPCGRRTDADDDPGIPAVTIADLARFAPDGAPLAAEPENVGVAGLPANFLATVSVQSVAGELFGRPLTVRFTPVAYDFAFGDGGTATTTTGGRSWTDLGQAQFTPTATSHVYAERGTYSATVDVRYSAEVDFGTGWIPIDGEVTAEGAAQEIRIFSAHTALVAYTCSQRPDSPGC